MSIGIGIGIPLRGDLVSPEEVAPSGDTITMESGDTITMESGDTITTE